MTATPFIRDISEPSPFVKDIKTYEVTASLIDLLYEHGSIEVPPDITAYPHQGFILKAVHGQQSALAIANKTGKRLKLLDSGIEFFGITARNTEQHFLMNMLRDETIQCIVVLGPAGTGKSVCVGSYCVDNVLRRKAHQKLVLSKPLVTVGGNRSRYLGAFPGDVEDKIAPFLLNFTQMFESIVGENGKQYIGAAQQKGVIDAMPIELLRGCSFRDTLFWLDECQSIDPMMMETVGSRIDDRGHSRLLLSGDLNQRDSKLRKNQTGLWHFVTSPHFAKSDVTAFVRLTKNMRGKVSQLFFDVFSGDSGDFV